MPTSDKSLWPSTIGANRTPSAIKILREQGVALSELTNGKLYGEVSQSTFPAIDSLTYKFNICLRYYPISHKLLTVKCSLLFDYPVTIINHEAGNEMRVHDDETFKQKLAIIFKSDATDSVLRKLLAYTNNV